MLDLYLLELKLDLLKIKLYLLELYLLELELDSSSDLFALAKGGARQGIPHKQPVIGHEELLELELDLLELKP